MKKLFCRQKQISNKVLKHFSNYDKRQEKHPVSGETLFGGIDTA